MDRNILSSLTTRRKNQENRIIPEKTKNFLQIIKNMKGSKLRSKNLLKFFELFFKHFK